MTARRWLVLRIEAPSHEFLPELAEGLIALGGTAVEEQGLRLTTYVPEPADPAGRVREALDELDAVAGGAALRLEWELRDDRDWSRRWKRGLRARRVGARLVVAPTWARVRERPDDVVVRIDPEMAFGTGEHATTRGALRLLETAGPAGARALDVGTGSGILAIAAARLGAREVLAVECDPEALPNARANLERNGVAGAVALIEGRVDAPFLSARDGAFDLVLANVLSGVLLPLVPSFRRALRAGGRLVLAGILVEEREDARRAARNAGFEEVSADEEGGWWAGLWSA